MMDTFEDIVKDKCEDSSFDDIKIMKFIEHLNYIKLPKNYKEPTKLIISTMSGVCKLGIHINLKNFVSIMEKELLKGNKMCEIKGIKHGKTLLGDIKKKKVKRKKTGVIKKVKHKRVGVEGDDFYNQATFVVNPSGNLENRNVTIELFSNGSVSLTGVKQINDGKDSVNYLVNIMNKNRSDVVSLYHGESKKDSDIKMTNYKTTMINSNYSLGFGIDRDILYEILSKEMGMYVSFNSKKYAGVKISFMYNEKKLVQNGVCNCKESDDKKSVCACKNFKENGVCDCYSYCKVNKKFKNMNKCSVITVAVFNKGNIIITGSKDFNHSLATYDFLNKLIKLRYSDIIRYSIIDFENELKSGELYITKDNKIVKNNKIVKTKFIPLKNSASSFGGKNDDIDDKVVKSLKKMSEKSAMKLSKIKSKLKNKIKNKTNHKIIIKNKNKFTAKSDVVLDIEDIIMGDKTDGKTDGKMDGKKLSVKIKKKKIRMIDNIDDILEL